MNLWVSSQTAPLEAVTQPSALGSGTSRNSVPGRRERSFTGVLVSAICSPACLLDAVSECRPDHLWEQTEGSPESGCSETRR